MTIRSPITSWVPGSSISIECSTPANRRNKRKHFSHLVSMHSKSRAYARLLLYRNRVRANFDSVRGIVAHAQFKLPHRAAPDALLVPVALPFLKRSRLALYVELLGFSGPGASVHHRTSSIRLRYEDRVETGGDFWYYPSASTLSSVGRALD